MDSSPLGLQVSTTLPVYFVVGCLGLFIMIPTFNSNFIEDFVKRVKYIYILHTTSYSEFIHFLCVYSSCQKSFQIGSVSFHLFSVPF